MKRLIDYSFRVFVAMAILVLFVVLVYRQIPDPERECYEKGGVYTDVSMGAEHQRVCVGEEK